MVPPVLSARTFAELLEEQEPAILDVRWWLAGPPGIEAYRRAHIPGAVFVDLERDLAGPPGPGRHPLPDAGTFGAAMRRAGVNQSARVVVYDSGDGLAAARCWWLLRHFGHDGVQVLDGGFPAWERAHLPVTADVPSPAPGDFRPGPGRLPLLDAAGAAELPRRGGILIDVRAPERFRGEREPIDRVAGHIPGARNLPASTNLDEDGLLLPPKELERRFAEVGIGPGAAVGVYCGSGVTAAQTVLALETIGIEASLYPGSWSEWITDPARPVAIGSE
jgi:thiosulfate/3-mercaptopyruvate sulfurtransferase